MAFSGDLEPWSGVDFWDCCFWWNGSPSQEDNNCHSLDKVVNTEEPVRRTLPCQRQDNLSINKIINVFYRNPLNIFFKKTSICAETHFLIQKCDQK